MKTTWKPEKENADGTGFTYYRCQCPQPDKDGFLGDLFELCYAPTDGRVWFWNATYESSATVRMKAESWDDAETVKRMLTKMRSRWMVPNVQSEPRSQQNNP